MLWTVQRTQKESELKWKGRITGTCRFFSKEIKKIAGKYPCLNSYLNTFIGIAEETLLLLGKNI